MPAVLLGNTDTPPELPEDEDATTHLAAFMILIDKNGNYVFEQDINVPVVPERAVKPLEAKMAMSALLDEIRAQEIAVTTINMQMQVSRQMQEQAANQQILQQMGRQPGR